MLLGCACHLSMCLNETSHQRLLLTTPKPAPPSWAWNPPPQKVTWCEPFWSLSPSGGSDRRGRWPFKMCHVWLASFPSIFAETSSSMRPCWGKPTSPSQRSGRVSNLFSGDTCICAVAQLKVMFYPDAMIRRLNSSIQTAVIASLISADLHNTAPVLASLLELMLWWSVNFDFETQTK